MQKVSMSEKKILRKAYAMDRMPTDDEVIAEKASLLRKHGLGTLDDSDARLFVAFRLCD